MGYYDFPHTRDYDKDLGFLIERYKNLGNDYKTLLQIYEQVQKNIKDITLAQLEQWLEDGTIDNIIEHLILQVQYYNTTVELINDSNVKENTLVFTLGYKTKYDGGQSKFFISSNKENNNSFELKNGMYANFVDKVKYIEELGHVDNIINAKDIEDLEEINNFISFYTNHTIINDLHLNKNFELNGNNKKITFTNKLILSENSRLTDINIINQNEDCISFDETVNNSTKCIIKNVNIDGVNKSNSGISFNASKIGSVLGGGLLGVYENISIKNCNIGINFDTNNAWYTYGKFNNINIEHCLTGIRSVGENQLSDVYFNEITIIVYDNNGKGIEHQSGSLQFTSLSIFNDLFENGTAYSLYLLEPTTYTSYNQQMSFINSKLEGAIYQPYLINWYQFINTFIVNRENANQSSPTNSSLSRFYNNNNLLPEDFTKFKTINISTRTGKDQYGEYIELTLTNSGSDGYFYYELGANFLSNIGYGNYVTNYLEYSTTDNTKLELFFNNYATVDNKFEYDEMINNYLYTDFNHRFKYTSTTPNLEYQEHNDYSVHLLPNSPSVKIYKCVCKLGLFIL